MNISQIAHKDLGSFVLEDRYAEETSGLLKDLKPYEQMGLLPLRTLDFWFNIGLPISIQKYLQCVIYFLATHPVLGMHRPLALTDYQKSAAKRIYEDIFSDIKYNKLRKPLEEWVRKTKHLFYQGERNEEKEEIYKTNWEGKLTEARYKNMILCFLKEYMLADLLNGPISKKNEKKWFVSSDYDDKQFGFDIACIDSKTKDIGLVDATMNPNRIRKKLIKLESFITPEKFDSSEFKEYILLANPTVSNLHTAALCVNREKFLYTFLTYISRVKKGKYNIEIILDQISDRPLPRERHASFKNTNDKSFFSKEEWRI